MIKAVINLDATRPQVFGALTDFTKYRNWLPNCESSEVKAVNGNVTDTEIVVKSMKTMTLGLRFELTPTQLLSFRMISGKDMKTYAGCYRLMDAADGKGTVVIAELELDAGPMAPRFLVDRMAKKAIDDTGVALKKYLNANRTLMTTAVITTGAMKAAPAKPRRARRILRVTKTATGHSIWISGQTYTIKG